MHRFLISLIILFFGSTQSFGQEIPDSTGKKVRKVSVLPTPSITYSPETSFAFGAVALFTFNLYQDTTTRSSNSRLFFSYTLRRQAILEGSWNYFFKEEKWFSRGFIHYSKFVDNYYGLGQNSASENEVVYESNRFILDIDGTKRIKNKLFLGIGFRYINYTNFIFLDPNSFVELFPSQTYGFKVTLINDHRNNILTPKEGHYEEVGLSFNRSSGSFVKLNLDARRYYTYKKNVFTARFFSTFNFGTAPFYDLALMGGDRFTRGYYFGRYRSNHMTLLQGEYRSPRWWRLGLAAFGGFSAVYSRIDYMKWSSFKPNIGAGLRILFDKKNNTSLRLDYAIGLDGQSGFYVSFGESF